ncbi:MAG: hypothetical protein ACE366_22295 [Bradymonadia bacterium]
MKTLLVCVLLSVGTFACGKKAQDDKAADNKTADNKATGGKKAADTPADKAKPSTPADQATANPSAKADAPAPAAEPPKVQCQKDKGCPAAEKVAKCVADIKAEPFTGVDLRQPPKVGSTVIYSGTLVANAGCTEMACDMPCCNTCSGDMVLGSKTSQETLAFTDEKNPKRFQARGDETEVCYPIEGRNKDVVVTGEFTLVTGQYFIKNPVFCQP